MVNQEDLNLHKPLEEDADTTIRRVPLQPRLATAALTLHGDYFRQLQGLSNRHILWHPIVQAYVIAVLSAFSVYVYRELFELSDSVGEFFHLFKSNKYILAGYLPVLFMIVVSLGLLSFMITDEFRQVSDGLAGDKYMLKLFRFPLRVYANASEKDLESKSLLGFLESASASTDIIEYRNSPIAVVTVIPLPDVSSSLVFYAKISGLHVRKVYRSAGLQEELLAFAKEKARDLCTRYAKDNKLATSNIKIVLVADAYSFDPVLVKLYESNGFTLAKKSASIDPFFPEKKVEKLFGLIPVAPVVKFFGISRVTYELLMDNTIELETQKPSKKLRKRKH